MCAPVRTPDTTNFAAGPRRLEEAAVLRPRFDFVGRDPRKPFEGAEVIGAAQVRAQIGEPTALRNDQKVLQDRPLVRGHAIVLAELGLCDYLGKAPRDPELFAGRWSRERRTDHLLWRLAPTHELWQSLGCRELSRRAPRPSRARTGRSRARARARAREVAAIALDPKPCASQRPRLSRRRRPSVGARCQASAGRLRGALARRA
jgi:hypothetical protein